MSDYITNFTEYSPEGVYGIKCDVVKIAIHGKARSGKSTFANMIMEILARRGMFAEEFAFAAPLYDIVGFTQQKLGVPVEKNGPLMQETANGHKRAFGDDVYARRLRSYMHTGSVVVSDLRHQVELPVCAEMGFTTVRITRNNRHVDRDPGHISEVDLDNVMMDVLITNDSDLSALRVSAEALVARLLERESGISAR